MRVDEEARAAAYRASVAERERAERAREASLAGDPAARLALGEAWKPFVRARAEARAPQPLDGDELRERREGPLA